MANTQHRLLNKYFESSKMFTFSYEKEKNLQMQAENMIHKQHSKNKEHQEN